MRTTNGNERPHWHAKRFSCVNKEVDTHTHTSHANGIDKTEKFAGDCIDSILMFWRQSGCWPYSWEQFRRFARGESLSLTQCVFTQCAFCERRFAYRHTKLHTHRKIDRKPFYWKYDSRPLVIVAQITNCIKRSHQLNRICDSREYKKCEHQLSTHETFWKWFKFALIETTSVNQ